MNFLKTTFFIIIFSAMFSSCSTDVDIYADYKDISVVYGLLDSSDDTTWIKVTKAFLGPGNALLFATDADSSIYPYKLDVRLTGIQNGVEKQIIVFDTITIKNKQAGDSIFYYPNQLVYYTTEDLNIDYKYNLAIDKENASITASTGLINDFSVTTPNRYINFMSDKDIEWYSTSNGKRYEVTLVINYLELKPGSTDTLRKSVNWYLGMRKASNTDGGEKMYIGYAGDVFYSLLENELENIPNVKRWTANIDVVIASASQEFDTYLEVNQSSTSLLSEVPLYTNIDGGIGLFASRKTISKSTKLSVPSETRLVNDYPQLGFLLKSE